MLPDRRPVSTDRHTERHALAKAAEATKQSTAGARTRQTAAAAAAAAGRGRATTNTTVTVTQPAGSPPCSRAGRPPSDHTRGARAAPRPARHRPPRGPSTGLVSLRAAGTWQTACRGSTHLTDTGVSDPRDPGAPPATPGEVSGRRRRGGSGGGGGGDRRGRAHTEENRAGRSESGGGPGG